MAVKIKFPKKRKTNQPVAIALPFPLEDMGFMKHEDFSIFIETLVDVVLKTEGSPQELPQLKHHIKKCKLD